MTGTPAKELASDATRAMVRDRYGGIATGAGGCPPASGDPSCCGESGSSCCAGEPGVAPQLGYTPEQLATLPEGANLGLGCGNPTAILHLTRGQTVLDLGEWCRDRLLPRCEEGRRPGEGRRGRYDP